MPQSNPNSNLNHAVNEQVKIIKRTCTVIAVGKISIKRQANLINKIHHKAFSIEIDLKVEQVRLCTALGEVLLEHRENVKKAGESWKKWAIKHFPKLPPTRRDHCMKLAEAGQPMENFYFLGVDFLYPFINLMYEFWGDPEIAVVADFFNLRVGKISADVDQFKYRVNIEKLHEYFKFKREMKGLQYDKDLVLDVISADVTFDNHDYKTIASLAPNLTAQFDYLFEMLVNGCSPKSQNSSSNQDSVIVLIAKFIQLAEKHISCGTFPNYVTRKEFKPFLSIVEKYFNNLPQ